MTIYICDMDGTLVYPSPYADPAFLALPVDQQKQKTHTPEFLQSLLDAPKAPWLKPDDCPLEIHDHDKLIIVTGRHDFTVEWTNEWIHKNLHCQADWIQTVAFNNAATYVAEKVAALKMAASMCWLFRHEPIEIYEDDPKVLALLEAHYNYHGGPLIHWIKDGQIHRTNEDMYDDEPAHEDDYERYSMRHR